MDIWSFDGVILWSIRVQTNEKCGRFILAVFSLESVEFVRNFDSDV